MLNSSQFSNVVTREDTGALRKHCRDLFFQSVLIYLYLNHWYPVNLVVQFCPMGKEYTKNTR